ncbi:MAG: hypothetical protein M5U26_01000 [Planctomycetota bacterium]|nr:hypothetical protein [Planctomycetota bacterium]
MFKVKSEWRADGAAVLLWGGDKPDHIAAFRQDWRVDDPRGPNSSQLVLGNTPPNMLIAFRGESGEFSSGRRDNAVCVALRNAEVTRFRLEAVYGLGGGNANGHICGIGLWDGGSHGITFGPREVYSDPRLAVWGSPRGWNNGNVDQSSNYSFNKKTGQLAVEADERNWTFSYREPNDMREEGWKPIHQMRVSQPMQPALMPCTWDGNGRVDYGFFFVRLIILPSDPLLQPKP